MKSRLRKKYCGCRCAHDKSFDDIVTDDPYPMYINWFGCARQPNYDNRPIYDIENELNKSIFDICENCTSFTVSRKAMRDYRAAKKLEKEYYKKHNPTSYFPFNKMEPGEELHFYNKYLK